LSLWRQELGKRVHGFHTHRPWCQNTTVADGHPVRGAARPPLALQVCGWCWEVAGAGAAPPARRCRTAAPAGRGGVRPQDSPPQPATATALAGRTVSAFAWQRLPRGGRWSQRGSLPRALTAGKRGALGLFGARTQSGEVGLFGPTNRHSRRGAQCFVTLPGARPLGPHPPRSPHARPVALEQVVHLGPQLAPGGALQLG
jgi:hypothetical protein